MTAFSAHYLENSRVRLDVAARMPPAWDAPEHKAAIYSAFERVQLAIECGNTKQVGVHMAVLRRLTDLAEQRRHLLLGARRIEIQHLEEWV